MSDFPLSVQSLSVNFGAKQVLKNISFDIKKGLVTAIAGPNGCGKTTLMRSLFGAQSIAEGQINIQGTPLNTMRTSEVGRKISVVSQFEHDSDTMRVGSLVLLGRSPHCKDIRGYCPQDYEIAKNCLNQVGMLESWNQYVDTLSGGERQRVLIARSLAQQCPCILLDEPTNHLDVKYQHEILLLLKKVAPTAVIILHDLNLVSRYCDEVIVLKDGQLVAQGCPQETLCTSLVRSTYDIDCTEVVHTGCKQFVFHR